MQIGGYWVPRRVLAGLAVVLVLLVVLIAKLAAGASSPASPLPTTPAPSLPGASAPGGQLNGRVFVSHCHGADRPACWSAPNRSVRLTVSGKGPLRRLTVHARFHLTLPPGHYRLSARSAEGRGQAAVDLLPGLGQGTVLVLR